MAESSPKDKKTLWEKEKLLITSKFLLFPQCFQKACTADMYKPRLVWEMVHQNESICRWHNACSSS